METARTPLVVGDWYWIIQPGQCDNLESYNSDEFRERKLLAVVDGKGVFSMNPFYVTAMKSNRSPDEIWLTHKEAVVVLKLALRKRRLAFRRMADGCHK